MEDKIKQSISVIVIIAGLLVGILITLPLAKQIVKSKTVTDCMTVSGAEITNTDASAWKGPNSDWYNKCLKDSGYYEE